MRRHAHISNGLRPSPPGGRGLLTMLLHPLSDLLLRLRLNPAEGHSCCFSASSNSNPPHLHAPPLPANIQEELPTSLVNSYPSHLTSHPLLPAAYSSQAVHPSSRPGPTPRTRTSAGLGDQGFTGRSSWICMSRYRPRFQAASTCAMTGHA